MGLTYYADGSATFRVWAPHLSAAALLVNKEMAAPKGATPKRDPEAVGMDVAIAPDPTLTPEAAAAQAQARLLIW